MIRTHQLDLPQVVLLFCYHLTSEWQQPKNQTQLHTQKLVLGNQQFKTVSKGKIEKHILAYLLI